MSLLSVALSVLGVLFLLVGVPPLLAPSHARDPLPPRYADAVGGRREWRGFGAGVTSIGISLLIIGNRLAA